MTNEEKAVIEAAKAWAHWSPEHSTALKDAVSALETAEPKQRKFWINYHMMGIRGSGEGGVDAYVTGSVTMETMDAWKAGISAANGGASIVIRTWTEMEV